ncbi:MAG: hypothetical protein MK212_12900 [Saprospiraceae bacterium]|nr:hypothetical protein [Saprospiraceae bacterium]
MNRYKQYLKKKNLAYCTLYPNVSNLFPLNLSPNSLVNCCKLGQLLETNLIYIEDRYWKEILSTFKVSDLCFCFEEATILIPSWDGISNSYQKLNLNNLISLTKIDLENYTVKDIILKDQLNFSFHSDDDNIPWIDSHIFMLNVNWQQSPNHLRSAFWSLNLDAKEKKSDWESIYQLSFTISIENKIKVIIPLRYNSLKDNRLKQKQIIYAK